MEDHTRVLAGDHDESEKRVTAKLNDRTARISDAVAELKTYRAICKDFILGDLGKACSHDVETHLWTAISRINASYRKQLRKTRSQKPTNHVEVRKLIKQYLEFLKDLTQFYRDLLQRLNANYGPIPELHELVSTTSAPEEASSAIGHESREHATRTCHQTLIYLGDLSRYRATEKLDKEPSLAPAVGYYDLAMSLRPSSGFAFHQQSIIAFEERNHFKAMYYLYRSIAVEEPHPNALSNLEIEFRKVRKAWDEGETIVRPGSQNSGADKAMLAWFVRLHSACFQGYSFAGHKQLEIEVQSQLASAIKSSLSNNNLLRICLTNFAAQETAASRFQNDPMQPELMQSYFDYVRLNIKTFLTLLNLLSSTLSESETHVTRNDQSLGSMMTHNVQRVLPALRLYSTWLLKNSGVVTAEIGDDSLQALRHQFWQTYARTLTSITAAFMPQTLPEIHYLLDEDVDTLGFTPLESSNTMKIWIDAATGMRKTKPTDVTRSKPEDEMLARIREMFTDALLVAYYENATLYSDGTTFTYLGASQSQNTVNVDKTQHLGEGQVVAPARHNEPARTAPNQDPTDTHRSPPNENDEARMSRMVDDLVGPDDDDGLQFVAPKQPITIHDRLEAPFEPSKSPAMAPNPRLNSVSSIWDSRPAVPRTPTAIDHPRRPSQTPPNAVRARTTAHSRVNSSASIQSQGMVPSSFSPTPPVGQTPHAAQGAWNVTNGTATMAGRDGGGSLGLGMHSPFLFGAGGGTWSSPKTKGMGETPANGQGG